MKRFLSLACFVLMALAARPQTGVSAATDKNQILIGEPFELQLKAVFPEGARFSWFELDSLDHFEILERSKIDSQASGDGIMATQTLLLTGWDSGRFVIPALSLGKGKTKPLAIHISYTPFDTTQPFHEIRDIIKVQKPQTPDWYWYLGFALLALLLFLLFFPGNRKNEEPKKVDNSTDAYKNALSRLDRLRRQDDDVKLYYSELTGILRDYLHQRKNIHSLTKTTDDLAVQIGGLGLPQGLYNRLLQALRLSDLVKFARFTPPPEEGEQARSVIRETIIAIEEKP
jgi:hypothetical protein